MNVDKRASKKLSIQHHFQRKVFFAERATGRDQIVSPSDEHPINMENDNTKYHLIHLSYRNVNEANYRAKYLNMHLPLLNDTRFAIGQIEKLGGL